MLLCAGASTAPPTKNTTHFTYWCSGSCNDDAVRSVQLVLGRLADAINEGRHGNNEQRGGGDAKG